MTLVDLVRQAADRWPNATAWIFDETAARFTFADVDGLSSNYADRLAALGVGIGDPVAVMVRNRPEFPLVWLALAKLGATLVPINTAYRASDAGHVLRHSGAGLVVADDEFADVLATARKDSAVERIIAPDQLTQDAPQAPCPTPVAERPVNIQYTSGTTGAPKGCVLPHRYWTTFADGMVTDFPSIDATDTILTAQPFHYVDPQWNVALGLRSGATLVVLDRFHPTSFMTKVRQYDVTWFYCLGMMPQLMLQQSESSADRNHRLRAVHASAIPPQQHAELERRWGVPWYEAFGMTETCSDIRMTESEHDEFIGTGCLGRPLPYREVAILSSDGEPLPRGHSGELAVRGVGLMLRYHDDAESTARVFADGWLHTGDLATMDESGRVFHNGRTKDMIRRSGENVAASEVERTLHEHPDVRLAAVTAVPDELRGEEIKASVVTVPGSTEPDLDELARFCTERLAHFKVPRYWSVVAALPMTDSQRVAKGQLHGTDPLAGTYDRVEQVWR